LIQISFLNFTLKESQLASEQKARRDLDGGKSQFEQQIRQLEEQLGMERKMSVTNQVFKKLMR